jgi:hypothetical protein
MLPLVRIPFCAFPSLQCPGLDRWAPTSGMGGREKTSSRGIDSPMPRSAKPIVLFQAALPHSSPEGWIALIQMTKRHDAAKTVKQYGEFISMVAVIHVHQP